MMQQTEQDDRTDVAQHRATRTLALVVLGAEHTVVRPLPETGSVIVGRGSDCDIRIDHASVSRRHARFEVSAAGVEVQDLGSANGTVIRPQRSAASVVLDDATRQRIDPGDIVDLGEMSIVLWWVQANDTFHETGAETETSALSVVQAGPMNQVRNLIDRVAKSGINVLLLGETGVGKEVLAERIHRTSARCNGPFVRLHCAALSESLFESELFGHERGAFTGATSPKAGLIESADGGTLMLDEIGEIPAATQIKLLRVLEERSVLRVGSTKPRPVDVRYVAATNRDLEAEVVRGGFRQDLFFRLDGISIRIPPLRERIDEIRSLADEFIDNACARDGRTTRPTLSADALALLKRHPWPGNIRELRHVMQRAVVLASGPEITPNELQLSRISIPPSARVMPARSDVALHSPSETLDGVEPSERERIVEALQRAGGNQTRAAALLGISRRTLVSRLSDYALPRPRKV